MLKSALLTSYAPNSAVYMTKLQCTFFLSGLYVHMYFLTLQIYSINAVVKSNNCMPVYFNIEYLVEKKSVFLMFCVKPQAFNSHNNNKWNYSDFWTLTTFSWRKVGSHRFLIEVGSLWAAVVPLAVSFTISLKPQNSM